jgi:cysteine-rich repeat protein
MVALAAYALLAGCQFDRSGVGAQQQNNNSNQNNNENSNQNANTNQNNTNTNNNTPPGCGDGVVGDEEGCDDGNTAPNDGCSEICQEELGWHCTGEPSQCVPVCGDGLILGSEQCDDGNLSGGDGCSSLCDIEPGWTCQGEPSQCTRCGNGTIEAGEACDDGNVSPGDGCSDSCQIEQGWSCQGEPSQCAETCGDSIIVGDEECDDGNAAPDDGCSDSCMVEGFNACAGEPSVCTCVIYADVDIQGGDGASWATAFSTVREAIELAATFRAQQTCEVWVAEGIYHVYESAPSDTIGLASDIGVYGGFRGSGAPNGGETTRSSRAPWTNTTVLDGSDPAAPATKVLRVVDASATTDATLDGFTVRNGDRSGTGQDGAGIYINGSDVTIRNCEIRDNINADDGGGLFATGGSFVYLSDSLLLFNTATDDGGGAMVRNGSSALIERCSFIGNTGGSGGQGGGLAVTNAAVVMLNSIFVQNTCNTGGAIAVSSGTLGMTNCTLFNNGSTATTGRDLHSGDSTCEGANTIFWNDLGADSNLVTFTGSPCQLHHSLFPAGSGYGAGPGENIEGDPLFVDTSSTPPDLHLQAASPCIDEGSASDAPATDYEGNPRVNAPDIGAYEHQP